MWKGEAGSEKMDLGALAGKKIGVVAGVPKSACPEALRGFGPTPFLAYKVRLLDSYARCAVTRRRYIFVSFF
jgi:hypothetical protein